MARRNGGDSYQYGVCTNTDFDGNGNPCPKCANKEVQKIRASKEFVCEECGESLTKVKGGDDPWWKKPITLIAGAVLGIAAIGVGIYALNSKDSGCIPPPPPPPAISLNHSEKALNVGETDTLKATVSPEDTQATIVWKASKDGTVDVQDGVVKAVKEGSGKVRVQAIVGKDTLSAICKYTVEPTENPKPITALTIEGGNFKLKIGNSKGLTYKAEPADNDENISWKSSDESIATVSNAGEVKALKAGKATISVVSDRSNKQADVVVTVTTDDGVEPPGSFTLSYGKYTGQVKNGYPNGQGRLVYTKARQINRNDPKGRMANPGDVVQGTFVNGFFTIGKHFDSAGNFIENINVGVVDGQYESK